MGRPERVAAIERLQQERGGTTVITYLTSTRQNAEAQMAIDVVPVIFRHLKAVTTPPTETKIDLFLHSNGGDGVVPWRLVTLLREYCAELTVVVPNRAFSAATLTALGADKVILHPMGMLGPTDPTVTNEFNPMSERAPGQLLGISVEDVAAYIALVKEDVGIGHEDELVQAFLALADKVHPLALGNVKRSTAQSRMIGQKLLGQRTEADLTAHQIEEVIDKLTSQLFYHGHPINRGEARELGLHFVEDATPAVEEAMWALFELYAEEMRLDEEFQPVLDAIGKNGALALPKDALILPQTGQILQPPDPMPVAEVKLDPLKSSYVESVHRCDVYQQELEVTLKRNYDGGYNANIGEITRRWTTET